MNKELLNIVNQEFIKTNLTKDVSSLLLKNSTVENIDIKALIKQIEAKNKCKTKLPTWYNTAQIYYPNKLNIEQTSSETTAEYKSNIIDGNSLIDITGGFGVDCFYFSKKFKTVTHCEINNSLSEIVEYNNSQLDVTNIKYLKSDGIEALKNLNSSFDWIYVDPSRRNDIKGKVFYLKDCLPNIPEHIDFLFNYSRNILIKVSPMLDISVGISEIKNVKEIHVVALNNETKELLYVLNKDYEGDISIKTVNIQKGSQVPFEFNYSNEPVEKVNYNSVSNYLYEPNSAILKAGAFKSIANAYQLDKLQKHSHLYTSENFVDFPGRSFIVLKVIPYNKKAIKRELGSTKANISIRNFPESVSQIKTKFKIKDGGNTYVFFTTDNEENKIAIICNKA